MGPATRMKPLLTLSFGSTPSCGAKIVPGFDIEVPSHASIFTLFHSFTHRPSVEEDFSNPPLDSAYQECLNRLSMAQFSPQ